MRLAGLVARRRPRQGVEAYAEAAERYTGTPAGFVARYWAGELARRVDWHPMARDHLKSCAVGTAPPAVVDACRWALGWQAIQVQEYSRAMVWLTTLIDKPSRAKQSEPATATTGWGLDLEGLNARALYWRARILHRDGDKESALRDYERLVQESPFAFHALLAQARMGELGKRVAQFPAESRSGTAQPRFKGGGHPDVLAASSYLRIGLPSQAKASLMALSRKNLTALNDRMLAAQVWQQLEDYWRSHRLAPLPWSGGLPEVRSPHWRSAAALGYPRVFDDVVESDARHKDVPAMLLYALIRAESGFSTKAYSSARALGLTQVTRRTAARTARRIKMKGFRFHKLKQPEVAVRIGSAYLAWLLQRYENPVLAIAAYNAGDRAVDRWLQRQGRLPDDMFIQNIPYGETRRYVQRVLSFWGIYSALYEKSDGLAWEFDFNMAKNQKG